MWTLILFGALYSNSSAMTSVPGFQSETACTTAGNAWLAKATSWNYKQAICVKMQ